MLIQLHRLVEQIQAPEARSPLQRLRWQQRLYPASPQRDEETSAVTVVAPVQTAVHEPTSVAALTLRHRSCCY